MLRKIYVTEKYTTTFICEFCDRSKTIAVPPAVYAAKLATVKFKCSCGHQGAVMLERRRFYRKIVDIAGQFGIRDLPTRGCMVIKDISQGGVKIKIPAELHKIEPDMVLQLSFKLPLEDCPDILRDAVAIRVDKDYIQSRFTSTEHHDKLGPFLYYNISDDNPSLASSVPLASQ